MSGEFKVKVIVVDPTADSLFYFFSTVTVYINRYLQFILHFGKKLFILYNLIAPL